MPKNDLEEEGAEAWRLRARRYRDLARCTTDGILEKLLRELADETEAEAGKLEAIARPLEQTGDQPPGPCGMRHVLASDPQCAPSATQKP